VKQHDSTVLHEDKMVRLVQASKSNVITSFFVKEGTSKQNAEITSELVL
jgi:hypothetical protein